MGNHWDKIKGIFNWEEIIYTIWKVKINEEIRFFFKKKKWKKKEKNVKTIWSRTNVVNNESWEKESAMELLIFWMGTRQSLLQAFKYA